MASFRCEVCGYVLDEEAEGIEWDALGDDWLCPVCGAPKDTYRPFDATQADSGPSESTPVANEAQPVPPPELHDGVEAHIADIRQMSQTGESISEPMRTTVPTVSWDDILIKGAQLARIPLNQDEPVNTHTVIGPNAKQPLTIETPVFITHMSYGSLSREAKISLARGSAAVKTAVCSGEGGILPESLENAHRYIFEYVPNQYSVTEENLREVDAIEIKLGQSSKPGMGGHLPGEKVTAEIAGIRGIQEGTAITSPAHFRDVTNREELRDKVQWLRETSGGRPIGVKVAAGHLEADLEIVLYSGPDFITVDGRPGATGSAPKFAKAATSLPTIYALCRARKFLDDSGAEGVTLVITGGLRVSPDYAKALALGADAIAIGTSALIAIGCQQYRICNTGRCPMGIATQDPALRARLNMDESAEQLRRFLEVCTSELKTFARLTGNNDVHKLSISDLFTTSSEISGHTDIEHA